MSWLDHPFYELLQQITHLTPYFLHQARYLGYVLIALNMTLTGIKFAISHQGLKEDLLKIAKSYLILVIVLHIYPTIVTGLSRISYKWTMASCNTTEFQQLIESTRTDTEFWNGKTDTGDPAWSSLVQEVKKVGPGGEIGTEYVLDLELGKTGYFSPTSIMRLIGMIMENIWHSSNRMERNSIGVPRDLTMYILSLLTAIIVLLCGIFAALQYFITVLEFAFITSVGILFLPGMCLSSTKFITEKFFGCLFGFFVKLLFVSIAMMLTFGGYIGLLTKTFTGTIDQVIYVVFTALFYMMICQSGPQLAASLLTGSPQMSLGELAAAGGAFAGAAMGASKVTMGASKVTTGATSAVVKGATKTAGEIKKASSAASTTKTLTSSKNNPKGSNKEAVSAFAGSLMNSTGQGIKSKLHGAGNTLKSKGAGSASSGKDGNRFSQTENMNKKNEDGNHKTTKEYMKERKNAGEDYALNRLANKEAKSSKKEEQKHDSTKSTHSPTLSLPQPTPLALPPPKKQLPPPQTKLLPPKPKN